MVRKSVTAPLLAVPTNLKYFPNTPRVYRGFGCTHAARRFAISASSTFNCISSLIASMVTESP